MSFVFAPGDLEFVASECCSFLSQARGAVSKKHECNRVTHPEISPNSLVSANVESKLVLTKKLGMKLPKFSPTPKTLGVDDLEPGGGGIGLFRAQAIILLVSLDSDHVRSSWTFWCVVLCPVSLFLLSL